MQTDIQTDGSEDTTLLVWVIILILGFY